MPYVYGCEKIGFVDENNDEGRECNETTCGYRMAHGKCGYRKETSEFFKPQLIAGLSLDKF